MPARGLYCALCEVVVDEVEAAVERTSSSHGHTVQTAWRIDEKRRIPYARTEHRLMEILEDELPQALPLYGACNHTDRQRLIRRRTAEQLPTSALLPSAAADAEAEGGLEYSPAFFSQSAALLSRLRSLYERLLESHLEDAILLFHKEEPDIRHKLCVTKARACKKDTAFDPFPPPPAARPEQRQAEGQQAEGEQQTAGAPAAGEEPEGAEAVSSVSGGAAAAAASLASHTEL